MAFAREEARVAIVDVDLGGAEQTVRLIEGVAGRRGLGGPDPGFGLEGGPGEPEVVAVDYGGEGLAGQGAIDGAAEDVPGRAGLFVDEGA